MGEVIVALTPVPVGVAGWSTEEVVVVVVFPVVDDVGVVVVVVLVAIVAVVEIAVVETLGGGCYCM